MAPDGRYELRGLDLYLDGERLPVSTAVVRVLPAAVREVGGVAVVSWPVEEDGLCRRENGRSCQPS